VEDTIGALVNLGYGQPQANAAIAAARELAGGAAPAALLKLGLREIAR
jgi:Holliday junction DNA helicase RuvA